MQQAVVALVDNALDQLEIAGDFETNRLDIKLNKVHNNIVLQLSDNGGGIEKRLLENIFTPFVATKKHRGLGMGLSIVKKIMDEHQFTIAIDNDTKGARVIITIGQGKEHRC